MADGMFAQLLAEQLVYLLVVLTAEPVKGPCLLAVLIYPRHPPTPQARRSWGAALMLSASRSAAPFPARNGK